VLWIILSVVGCVDHAAIDERECRSKSFDRDVKEFEYCLQKLQQFRDE